MLVLRGTERIFILCYILFIVTYNISSKLHFQIGEFVKCYIVITVQKANMSFVKISNLAALYCGYRMYYLHINVGEHWPRLFYFQIH